MSYIINQIGVINKHERMLVLSGFVALTIHLFIALVLNNVIDFEYEIHPNQQTALNVELTYFADEAHVIPIETENITSEVQAELTTESEPVVEPHPLNEPQPLSDRLSDEFANDEIITKDAIIVIDQGDIRDQIDKHSRQSFNKNSQTYIDFEKSFEQPTSAGSGREDIYRLENKNIQLTKSGQVNVRSQIFGYDVCYKFDANPDSFAVVLPLKCSTQEAALKFYNKLSLRK